MNFNVLRKLLLVVTAWRRLTFWLLFILVNFNRHLDLFHDISFVGPASKLCDYIDDNTQANLLMCCTHWHVKITSILDSVSGFSLNYTKDFKTATRFLCDPLLFFARTRMWADNRFNTFANMSTSASVQSSTSSQTFRTQRDISRIQYCENSTKLKSED